MSLLDDLRAAARAIDPQFHVSTNEVTGVVSALAAYAEHGDEFLKAAEAGAEDVTNLLAPPPPEPEPAPARVAAPSPVTGEPAAADTAPAAAGDSTLSDDELARRISDLQAQQASRRATAQATVVEHHTGPGPGPTEPS